MGASVWASVPELSSKRHDADVVRWGSNQTGEVWVTGGKSTGANSGKENRQTSIMQGLLNLRGLVINEHMALN